MINVNLYYGYIKQCTIDANKHPDEQVNDLIDLIKNCTDSELDIFSNSPYVMFRITLLEAYSNKNIPTNQKLHGDITISNKHFEVLKDGTVVEGKYYKTMMSDENLLNDKLIECNDLFSDLLDLEDKLNK